jgi:membrane-bound lytic murein transglycosylase A
VSFVRACAALVLLCSDACSSKTDAGGANAAAGTSTAPRATDAGTTATTGFDAAPAAVAATVDGGAGPCAPASPDSDPTISDALTLAPAAFTDLPGWSSDHLGEALPAFLASCAELAQLPDNATIGVDGYSGKVHEWRHACTAASHVASGDDAAARAFFEHEFVPYQASGTKGPVGLMTSYDVQSLRGSRTRHDQFQYPIYRRPGDLVSVDLSSFIRDGKGRHLWGLIDGKGELAPYLTRAEIRKGALDGKHLELLWVDDPVDVLFAQIEGSGKVTLDDGHVVWIEYDGKNGRAYRGVGSVLRESGELRAGKGTMQDIRAWFAAHTDRRDEIMDQDASYVFFKLSARDGSVGTQKVILTAQRSAAVDHGFVAFSTPIWVDTRAPIRGATGTAPWQHLVIAQDTGGAILGPVRADLYWGDDEAAADVSGRMGGKGSEWFLLPRGLVLPAKVLGTAARNGAPSGAPSGSAP